MYSCFTGIFVSVLEDRDEDACKTRIHSLVSAYRSYKDEYRKTGNGTLKKKPAFFEEVGEFLAEKPCTKPKVVVNSAQIIIGDGAEKSEEEGDDNVENVLPNLPSCSSSDSNNNNKASGPKEDCVTCPETATEDKKPVFKAGTKKRKMSTTDAFAKIDKTLDEFVSYQQTADRRFLEAEEGRERREEEEQEFLLKLV